MKKFLIGFVILMLAMSLSVYMVVSGYNTVVIVPVALVAVVVVRRMFKRK